MVGSLLTVWQSQTARLNVLTRLETRLVHTYAYALCICIYSNSKQSWLLLPYLPVVPGTEVGSVARVEIRDSEEENNACMLSIIVNIKYLRIIRNIASWTMTPSSFNNNSTECSVQKALKMRWNASATAPSMERCRRIKRSASCCVSLGIFATAPAPILQLT
jgi:hypothetical protein